MDKRTLALGAAALTATMTAGFLNVQRSPPPPPPPEPIAAPIPTAEVVIPDLTDRWATPPDEAFRDLGEGLRVADLVVGTGAALESAPIAHFEYRLWLADGTLVGSSVNRPTTVEAGTGSVFRGWEQGMAGMAVGGSRQIRIPAALGFGDRATKEIPANSDVVLELVLRRVSEPRVAPQTPRVPTREWTPLDNEARWVDLVVGDGVEATPTSTVEVEITGWLQDGTRFDSTLERSTPTLVTLGEYRLPRTLELVIPGMKLGGHRQVVAPPHAAFGSKGKQPMIPPDSTITWEVILTHVD